MSRGLRSASLWGESRPQSTSARSLTSLESSLGDTVVSWGWRCHLSLRGVTRTATSAGSLTSLQSSRGVTVVSWGLRFHLSLRGVTRTVDFSKVFDLAAIFTLAGCSQGGCVLGFACHLSRGASRLQSTSARSVTSLQSSHSRHGWKWVRGVTHFAHRSRRGESRV